ncbi:MULTISPECIES: serine hydrolase domain-containing protein [Streptomyces]|uniref:Serine hydrolase domain-containing protein n=1 Tax=Streptomyces solicathayae TaxID=3081768 RepID=A0ABZ0LTX2_9ACTN|nr:serine hydrolase domain-containing protein [Streptomyces sp. HUAS YS2]WOX22760.1 serine hydrolase domain-containing protein [Streptomyces sp. HUAS YS2]
MNKRREDELMKMRKVLCGGMAALTIGTGTVTAAAAADGAGAGTPAPAGSTGSAPARLNGDGLQSALDGVHRAGIPGVFAEVREAGRTWRGASGVADLDTDRPVRPDMRHRVGSITKTFVAVAVMREVEAGRVRLDAPIGDYLPDLVPGERGRQVTVRMLLNHTSGIAEYIPYAFPSIQGGPSGVSARSLDENRFRRFRPAELIALGLAAPPAAEPGTPTGVYSNTNYLLLGQLLERVSGAPVEDYITEHVIEPAGLRHTGFPTGPRVQGPHSKMYEALWGVLDPPRDYSVYDMSWVMAGAGLVSTMEDLNLFYGKLLAGRIVAPSSLAEMRRTVPVVALDGSTIQYGLGLHKLEVPGCGTFWGNEGTVWGAGTVTMTREDGGRQFSFAINLMRWSRPSAIDGALSTLRQRAMDCPVSEHS